MTREAELIGPVLTILKQEPSGQLSTSELRKRVRAAIPLTCEDLAPLANRPDQRIDQIIRNLKSHKKSPGNPFAEGLLADVPRGFKLTAKGKLLAR